MSLEDLGFDPAKCLIGGAWVAPAGGQTLPLMNPSTGEQIGEIARGQEADVDAAIDAARRAFEGGWASLWRGV